MADDSTGESKLLGVSIRSWAAVYLIVIGAGALAYAGDVVSLKELALAAMAFLFGKAAGANSPRQ